MAVLHITFSLSKLYPGSKSPPLTQHNTNSLLLARTAAGHWSCDFLGFVNLTMLTLFESSSKEHSNSRRNGLDIDIHQYVTS